MPGPGHKKSKSKKSAGSSREVPNVDIPTVLDTYVDEVNDAEGWETIVEILCRILDLPGACI